MNVISASRRTDIPAFHAEWFMNRIRCGRTAVASPFNRGRLEVSLAPEDVAAIVFWTKNPSPLLEHLTELQERGHCFTFLYTINNYPRYVEPRVPELTHTMKVVERLSKSCWRTVVPVAIRYDSAYRRTEPLVAPEKFRSPLRAAVAVHE